MPITLCGSIPLWLGTLPARTKAFLEHLARQ